MNKKIVLFCSFLCLLLLAQIPTCLLAEQADAATRRVNPRNQAATQQPEPELFLDLSGHWAESSARRLYTLELVQGYPDRTYKPDRLVSKLETVVLILRSGGFTEEAEKLAAQLEKESGQSQSTARTSSRTTNSRTSTPARGTGTTPTTAEPTAAEERKTPLVPWGQAYVDLAIERGFLSLDRPTEFDHDAPATRIEVAELLAKAMYLLPPDFDSGSGQVFLAVHPSMADEAFIDVGALNRSKQTVVAAVTNAGVMTGYPDGTFRPYDSLTRAEAATILSRLVDQDWVKVSSERRLQGLVSGMVKNNNQLEITLTNLQGERQLKISPQAKCFRNGEARDVTHANNYRCELVLNSKKEIDWIEILESKGNVGERMNIRCSIKMVLLGEENILLVSDMNVNDRRLPIAWDAVLTGNSRDKSFASLQTGVLADVKLSSDGEVKEVAILDVKTRSGTVDRLDGVRLYLTGSNANTNPPWFSYYDRARIVDKDGIYVENIRPGDRVEIIYIDPIPDEIDDEQVVEIRVTR